MVISFCYFYLILRGGVLNYTNTVLAGVLCSLAFPLLADGPAPEDIPVKYPQQFISSYTYQQPTLKLVDSFQYTVQVRTDIATDNIYYHLDQKIQPFNEYQPPGSFNPAGPVTTNSQGMYYTGIQPHANGTVAFRFSSFIPGSVPKAKNCHGGADGSSNGVTCGVDRLPYTPGGKYTIKVEMTSSDNQHYVYTGWVTDETTHVTTKIGAWSLEGEKPARIYSDVYGTAELYNIQLGATCADIPLVDVEYSNISYNGIRLIARSELWDYPPSSDPKSVHTCTGVNRSTSAKLTRDLTSYTIKNSD